MWKTLPWFLVACTVEDQVLPLDADGCARVAEVLSASDPARSGVRGEQVREWLGDLRTLQPTWYDGPPTTGDVDVELDWDSAVYTDRQVGSGEVCAESDRLEIQLTASVVAGTQLSCSDILRLEVYLPPEGAATYEAATIQARMVSSAMVLDPQYEQALTDAAASSERPWSPSRDTWVFGWNGSLTDGKIGVTGVDGGRSGYIAAATFAWSPP